LGCRGELDHAGRPARRSRRLGIDDSCFRDAASVEIRAFNGEPQYLPAGRPLFYVVPRGDTPGSLEATFAEQAQDLGVAIHRGATLAQDMADICATGVSRRGFFLDVGLTFRTDLSDRVVVLVKQRMTPKACAYLIVVDGTATLAVLITRAFRDARRLLAATVAAFQRIRPFEMRDARLHGGFGGGLTKSGTGGRGPLHVGEAAGLLDYLWGFGIRYALSSGALAARALMEERDYEQLLAQDLHPLVQASLLNRRLYDYAGNRLCRALIRRFCARDDLHGLLRRCYRPQGLRIRCLPWIQPLLLPRAR
jgi:hypothetical protein